MFGPSRIFEWLVWSRNFTGYMVFVIRLPNGEITFSTIHIWVDWRVCKRRASWENYHQSADRHRANVCIYRDTRKKKAHRQAIYRLKILKVRPLRRSLVRIDVEGKVSGGERTSPTYILEREHEESKSCNLCLAAFRKSLVHEQMLQHFFFHVKYYYPSMYVLHGWTVGSTSFPESEIETNNNSMKELNPCGKYQKRTSSRKKNTQMTYVKRHVRRIMFDARAFFFFAIDCN